ncbi:uncharacterized protein SPSK_01153 [Sporothrix schenckii 1099-18]|uniref:Amidoligase enzyme n=1 Tax=Sporothrix schenckii 1099-18 TaxID=1397361 RepID=A0A0F2LWM5_SPOSC|nr:uncharacterized protein SPSK_01153 [Sporothrix schenckii 1099-18]KJR81234.1 hypothetical protein SPSK_01153 [Sporothrix schenckii 1099-18]
MPSAVVLGSCDGTDPPAGPDTVEDVCLGMELKFLLLGLPRSEAAGIPIGHSSDTSTTTSQEAYQKQAYTALARVIERRAGPDKSAPCPRAPSGQPRAISKSDISESGLKERDYWPSHWIVKKANSVEHMKEDPRPDSRRTNGIAIPVELNSPKLAWRDLYAPFLISKVLSQVKTLPTCVNYTCDVHVHVGRCDGTAFTLPTLKKLATIFWLAEPILRSVRNPHSPNYSHAYTWGFDQRRYSRLALALDNRSPATDNVTIGEDLLARVRSSVCNADDDEWHKYMNETGKTAFRNEALRAIWQSATSQELGLLLSGSQREYRRLGFNFSAFGGEDERSRTNPRTIEFRILEGTLNEELVQGWYQICGKLVELGTKGRQARFCEVVQYLVAQQPAYDELLKNTDSGRLQAHVRAERGRVTRDLLFAEFMEVIGVEAAAYKPFQEKIRREYGSS